MRVNSRITVINSNSFDLTLKYQYFYSTRNRFVCLFVPSREFFTHMETSLLPVKGCKFWPLLGTHGLWAVRVFKRATTTATRAQWSSPRTRDTHTCWRAFGSGAVTTFFTTYVCRDQGSNPDLPHARRTLFLYAPRQEMEDFHLVHVYQIYMYK